MEKRLPIDPKDVLRENECRLSRSCRFLIALISMAGGDPWIQGRGQHEQQEHTPERRVCETAW